MHETADAFHDTNRLAFRGFSTTQESECCAVEFAGFNQLTRFVNRGIDSAHMTQCRRGCQAIHHLGNADFATAALLDTEVTGRKCAINTGLDRRRFYHLTNIGRIDDILVIFRGTPRPIVDFFHYILLHLLHHSIIVVAEQIVQQYPGGVDALVYI